MLLNISRTQEELKILENSLMGDISFENGTYNLALDNTLGEGQIRCVCFHRFITSIEFDLTLKDNMLVSLGSDERDVLYFMYNLKGSCAHHFSDDVDFLEFEPLQTMVVASSEKKVSQLLIREGERFHFSLIRIDRTRYEDILDSELHGVDIKLKELLCLFEEMDLPLHQGKHNLNIGEHLKALERRAHSNDLSSLLHFEGISNLILAEQIDKFFKEVSNQENQTTLTQRELKGIDELSDFIRNYPEIQHSVKDLCERVGISSAKLQEGFKFMHNQTVSNFIRNVRLEKAEYLIRQSELNISEIVYSIGLTSRSYFCKIFKQKYERSPKEYRKKANFTLIA